MSIDIELIMLIAGIIVGWIFCSFCNSAPRHRIEEPGPQPKGPPPNTDSGAIPPKPLRVRLMGTGPDGRYIELKSQRPDPLGKPLRKGW